ncbi:MAG: hypothetical protein JXR03_04590 [Cyclobacteriaceae bacterium]
MPVLRKHAFIILCFCFYIGRTQELPPIQNFTPLDYASGNQNWGITQSDDKLIYAANNEGLLEFNGAKWTLYASPNETVMRSVKVIGDRVFTGCYMEFGYWEKSKLGVLNYTSLSKKLKVELVEDEEFWGIIGLDDYVIFQSLKSIYIYDTSNESVTTIRSERDINKVFLVDEHIYYQCINKGIYKIENGEGSLFIKDPLLSSTEVVNIFSEGKEILLLTRNNGLFVYEENQLKKWENAANKKFSNLGIYSTIKLQNGNFALGTISFGLICLDKEMNFLFEINQSNGLLNNTVLSVFEDIDNNIWTGLDNGISYVNIDKPVKIFKDEKGALGSVYTSAIFGGNLYLGSNQGLFFKRLGSNDAIRLIEGTQGQVWCLKVLGNTLFCGHHNGTYVINEDKIKQVSSIQGTWNIDLIDENSDMIIQGNYDGLYILEKFRDSWQLRNKIDGFNTSSRYFEVLGSNIFVNHEYKGVFELTVDRGFSQIVDVRIDTLLKGANSSLSNYNGDVLYTSKKGIFIYDKSLKMFQRDTLLSNIYREEDYISGRIVTEKSNDKFWIFTKDNLMHVSSGNLSKVPKVRRVPLTLDVRRDVVEYENMISINGLDKYVLGTSSGYMILDIDDLSVEEFNVYISDISVGINKDHSASENLIDKHVKGVFENDENNLRINFHAAEYYSYFEPNYQFQLVGIYDLWSEWTDKSTVFFKNLPAGDYTFNVRAKVGEKVSENIATYGFSVAKPWYFTNFMLAFYVLGVILFSIFMHNVYKRYYRGQQAKLIEKNKKEIELTKLQSEKEIIDLKNEQLKKDYVSKSNEVAASAISIVKKNELLMQIKDKLKQIEGTTGLAPVIKIIDRNLNHDENWELFKEAFDNADREFFKKIKELHSDLSPNDLKLCAYLRLNLSSKEIAPLFNISPRSVEIKRYRLRKKMNLGSNENLTNYILDI